MMSSRYKITVMTKSTKTKRELLRYLTSKMQNNQKRALSTLPRSDLVGELGMEQNASGPIRGRLCNPSTRLGNWVIY